MNHPISVWRLHLNRRRAMFVIPLWCIVAYVLLTLLIALMFWRFGAQPGTPEWVTGMQNNPGVVYALGFYLVTLGVLAVAHLFPFSLMFGVTRSTFVVGTVIWQATISLLLAVVFLLLSVIEMMTHYWFMGLYIFNVSVLGGGNPVLLLFIVFFGVFVFLASGGLFAASWVRAGVKGPQLVGLGFGVLILLLAAAAAPYSNSLIHSFQLWWLLIMAVVVIAIDIVGTWLLLRTACIR